MNSPLVISGISGRYPEANDLEKFWSNLIKSKNCATIDGRRWNLKSQHMPSYLGKILDVELFDGDFFQLPNEISDQMFVGARILHEVIFEAFIDAGFVHDKHTISTARTGFFLANCSTNGIQVFEKIDVEKKFAHPNISWLQHNFNFCGPVVEVDTACASGGSALDLAFRSIRAGQCDQAIVAGYNICLDPNVSRYFKSLGMVNMEGRSKCLDDNADGYCRSESVVAMLIQKRCNAKRIYASIINIASNCDGYTEEGITFPKFEVQCDLLTQVFKGTEVNPLDINYVESHITGTQAGDLTECASLFKTLRSNSEKPLLLGCLKSNIGHSEGSSILNSISKVAKIFQTELIPPNLHFKQPNSKIEGLIKGILKPVLSITQFQDDLIPVNAFGFGGVNHSILLKANPKRIKQIDKILSDNLTPRLINFCNRTYNGLEWIVQFISEQKGSLTKYTLALLNNLSKITPLMGFNHRGYLLLDDEQTIIHQTMKQSVSIEEEPLWLVFTSMFGVTSKSLYQLAQVPLINSRIESLNTNQLKSIGIDVIKMIESNQQDVTSFLVSSIAIQIALSDLLIKKLNINPKGIIGHSIGLIAAAYADNCITDEEALLIGYHIGEACKQFKGQGVMAYINLPWEEIEGMKVEGIEIASHESGDWTMITGIEKSIENFILKESPKVRTKIIDSRGIPFHSSSIKHLSQIIEFEVDKIIKSTKNLTKLCPTFHSTHEIKSQEGLSFSSKVLSSALISPSYLYEKQHQLPLDCLSIVIGASYVDYSFESSSNERCINMIDTSQNELSDNQFNPITFSLYKSFGEIYLHGLNPSIENLYDSIDYPVPIETQSIGHLIKWKHDKQWPYQKYEETYNFINIFPFSLSDEHWSFLLGHTIDGKILFPATGFLYIAHKMICTFLHFDENHPIELFQVNFHRAVHLNLETNSYEAFCKINPTFGTFSIFLQDSHNHCVTGKFQKVDRPTIPFIEEEKTEVESDDMEIILESEDIYKELRIRGYDYSGSFKGIVEASSKGSWGLVKDTGHWISFADSCLQIALLASRVRKLIIPVSIEYVYIDPSETINAFKTASKTHEKTPLLKVFANQTTRILSTNGLIVKNVMGEEIGRRLQSSRDLIITNRLTPFDCNYELSMENNVSRESYTSYCLKLIEHLNKSNDNQSKFDEESVEAIENLLKDSNSSNTLLRILYETVKGLKDKEAEINEELNSQYEKYEDSLIKDNLFLRPLEVLYNKMLNILNFNLRSRSVWIATVNFIKTPNEIKLDKFAIGMDIHSNIDHFITSNLQGKANEFKIFDARKEDGKIDYSKSYKLIILRDKSTYSMYKESDYEDECTQYSTLLHIIFNSLQEGGFCIILARSKATLVERKWSQLIGNNLEINFDKSSLQSIAYEIGFTWICFKEMSNEGFCSVLLRKPFVPAPDQKVTFIRSTLDNFEWIDVIKEALKNENHKIWLIGGGYENGLVGMTKSLLGDQYGYNIRCYHDLSRGDGDEIIVPDDILAKDLTLNIVDINGSVGIHEPEISDFEISTMVEAIDYYADVRRKGDLSSLSWFKCFHSRWNRIPNDKFTVDHEKIIIYYGALNFKDIMVTTGRIPLRTYPLSDIILQRPLVGIEYSGIDEFGNKVMGIASSGAIATSILEPKCSFKCQIPYHWTLAEAATVPVVYLTAYYGLISRGNMLPGESVLIHAGSGGVGQAAISICLARGCEVFTTVGTQEKRDFIKKRFPSIDDDHIGDSRSTSFEEMIMRMTNGRGVDLVLNSLSDDKFTASVRCLADFGRFIEISKYQIALDIKIDSCLFENNKTFHAICLAFLQHEVFYEKRQERIKIWDDLVNMLTEGIKSGEVVPLPTTIFQMDQLEESFRFMATGKHIGKVLIQMRDETEDPNEVKLYPAIGQTFFDLEKSYIITGGLGGLGLEVAYWMVQRGATNLILTSRSGIKTKYQEYMLDRMRNNGYTHTKVIISNEDCHTYESAERLINQAQELGPIGGIFFSAMVLNDALFENRTVETFAEAVNPKAIACSHLDKLTRLLPYKLDYFIGFSSFATEFGNIGQENYCFSNCVVENICSKRRLDGHHGLAIRWGPIGDVGWFMSNPKLANKSFKELLVIRLPMVLFALDNILDRSGSLYTVIKPANSKKTSHLSSISFKQQISNILGVDKSSKVDSEMTLGQLGLDSLMATEIKQLFDSRNIFTHSMNTQEIRDLKLSLLDEIDAKLEKSKEDDMS